MFEGSSIQSITFDYSLKIFQGFSRSGVNETLKQHEAMVCETNPLKIMYQGIEYHNRLPFTLIKFHVNLMKFSSIPQFECYLFDLLHLICTKPLPRVSLEDFFVGKSRCELLIFGEIRYLFQPTVEAVECFQNNNEEYKIQMEDVVTMMKNAF